MSRFKKVTIWSTFRASSTNRKPRYPILLVKLFIKWSQVLSGVSAKNTEIWTSSRSPNTKRSPRAQAKIHEHRIQRKPRRNEGRKQERRKDGDQETRNNKDGAEEGGDGGKVKKGRRQFGIPGINIRLCTAARRSFLDDLAIFKIKRGYIENSQEINLLGEHVLNVLRYRGRRFELWKSEKRSIQYSSSFTQYQRNPSISQSYPLYSTINYYRI